MNKQKCTHLDKTSECATCGAEFLLVPIEVKEGSKDIECKQNIRELIKTYKEYIELLEQENSDLWGLHIAHGNNGNEENYQKGIKIRQKIKDLEEELSIKER